MNSLVVEAITDQYSAANALVCARVARLAYGSPGAAERLATRYGLELIWHKTLGSHFGLALGNSAMILVAFRGTNERRDWLTNLNILAGYSPLGQVHGGFLRAANLFLLDTEHDGLAATLRQFRVQQPIWVTGHSLGGAIALLAAVHLHVVDGIDIAGLYTFGQPPVGGLRFRRALREKFPDTIYRFVNSIDAVSDLPGLCLSIRPLFLHGLTHVGGVRYFDADGQSYDDAPWVAHLLDQFKAVARHGGSAALSVHAMKEYIKVLSRVSASMV